LLPALAEVLGDDPLVRVEVAHAPKADLAATAPAAGRLVANLPYNIAATLVLKVLAEAPAIGRQVVMVQREVGERLAAAPAAAAAGAARLRPPQRQAGPPGPRPRPVPGDPARVRARAARRLGPAWRHPPPAPGGGRPGAGHPRP